MTHAELHAAAHALTHAKLAGGAAPLMQWAEQYGPQLIEHGFEDAHLDGWLEQAEQAMHAIKENNPAMLGARVANLFHELSVTKANRQAARQALGQPDYSSKP